MIYLEPFMQTVLQISISMAAVIGFLLLLIPVWQQRYSARWRKVIWLVIALRLLIPFSIELPVAPVHMNMDLGHIVAMQSYPAALENTADMQGAVPGEAGDVSNATLPLEMAGATEKQPLSEFDKPITVWNRAMVLSAVWIIGVSLFVLFHAVQYVLFRRRVLAYASPMEHGEWIVHQAGNGLNLNRYPDVLISRQVQSPMLIGFIKPMILLPERIYGEQELLLILRHELMHYKHHDLWYKLILLAANAVHWFNPCVYLMARQAGRDEEQVCDDFVVAGKDMAYRKAYSMTILNTMANQRGVALSTYLSKDAQNTKKRFAGILQPKQYKKGIAVFCGIVLLAVIASGCLQFTKPVAGDEYLERIKAYLPEGITFSDAMTYERWDAGDGTTTHYWTDWEDTTGKAIEEVQKNAANSCWISMTINQDNQILAYQINAELGYREKENLNEKAISDEKAEALAKDFLADIAKEENLSLKNWMPRPMGLVMTGLPEGYLGWIADSAEKDYHYEIIIDKELGTVTGYQKYYDSKIKREQLTSWIQKEAMKAFQPYPRIRGVEVPLTFITSWEENNLYWMGATVQLSYYGENNDRNLDSIWGSWPVENAREQTATIPIQVSAEITLDDTLNLERCQLYLRDIDNKGNPYLRQISGFDAFIGKSLNAMPVSASGESSEMMKAARIFAENLAALTNAQDEAARNRIKNHPILKIMELPDYAYKAESELLWESIHTDFFRRYGQFGNDGESYEPVVLSAEMEKKDGTTDTLTMWLITEDGKWKVSDAVLEPFAEEKEEPASFWEYSGYLDEFPWENTENPAPFSCDYDGDGKSDRVYRSKAQDEGYYQYQIEFASGEVLKIEEPVSNIGYPQIDGVDLTGDRKNEIVFHVGYPTSTNPLAFGELVVYEKQKGEYKLMELPFVSGDEPYQQMLPVTYSKADGQAVKVSVQGADFTQVVPIENDDLWNGYQYSSTYTKGETMQHCIWAYKVRETDGKSQLICSIQLFDKWSDDGLNIALAYKNGELIIDNIEFCEDVYTEWM